VLALALALGCGLAAGCGKGGSIAAGGAGRTDTVTAATAPQTAAPAPPSAGGGVSRSQADAFARAVNLTIADVPGFLVKPHEARAKSAAEQALQARLRRCVGSVPGLGGGEAERSSPEFARSGSALQQTVSSSVSFAPSAAAAKRELALLRSSHTRVCLSSYLHLLFSTGRFGNGAVKRVSIVQGTPPAAGTSGGFGWRITAVLQVHGLTLPFYLDALGFVYGPAEVTLQSTGLLVPFPAQAEEQLFTLLLARARAHPLPTG